MRPPALAIAAAACLSGCLPLLAGCEKAMRNMYEQPRYQPMAPSTLWPDGRSARPLEPGVVVYSAGAIAASSSGRAGEEALPAPQDRALAQQPQTAEGSGQAGRPAAAASRGAHAPFTIEMLQRGRERYDIYCAPCHSVTGDGDGMVVRRGFPAPQTLHSQKLRAASDQALFEAIANGYGEMAPFADRIGAQDRWAIVGYLRALQRSRNARLDDVPPAERGDLMREAR